MKRKVFLLLLLAQVCLGTEPLLIDSKTHKVLKPDTSPSALWDFDFSEVTTNLSGSGGGGSPPGGQNLQLQFNNSGLFGGVPWGTYDGTTINFTSGIRLTLSDPNISTAKAKFDLSSIPAGTTRTVRISPDSDSTTVVGGFAPTANDFLQTIFPDGSLFYVQPLFSNIGGSLPINRITIGNNKLIGHGASAGTAAEEISLGTNLSITGTTLNATGGGGTPGGGNFQLQWNDTGTFNGLSSLTTDGSNVFGIATQFFVVDPTDSTKRARFELGSMTTGTTSLVQIAANSTTVRPDIGSANNFLTSIGPTGLVGKAQVGFGNLSGNIGVAQNNLPIGANIYIDNVNGVDASGLRGRLDKPFKTISAALAVAQSGDAVYIGPGTFSQSGAPLVLPANVGVYGSGADSTFITGTTGLTRCVVEPSNSSFISDVTIQNTATTGAAFGVGSSSSAFTSATLASSRLLGNSDGIFINKAGASGLLVQNCIVSTLSDTVESAVGGIHTLRNVSLFSDGTTTSISRGINCGAGILKIYDSTISVGNSIVTNVAADATGSSAMVELHNTTIARNSTGTTNLDLRQASSALMAIDNVTRTDYAALATSGIITEISRYLVNQMTNNKLLGRGTLSGVPGPIDEITLGSNLSLSGTTLNASSAATGGGNNTELQYNNVGSLGGITTATYVGSELLFGAGATVFTDNADPTKRIKFALANVPTGTTQLVLVPNSTNPVIVASGAAPSNQFGTGISALGIQNFAQPTFGNLFGRLALSQTPVTTATKLIGRGNLSGNGDMEEISLGTGLSMVGTTLNATGLGGGGNVSVSGTPTVGQLALWTDATTIQGVTTLPAAAFPALTGDVTTTAGSLATTIAANAVTLTKLANIATDSILGRSTTGGGNVQVLTSLPFAATGDVTRPVDSNVNTLVNIPIATTIGGVAGARGEVLYYGSGGLAKLAPGTDGYTLVTHGIGADPDWQPAGGAGSISDVAYNAISWDADTTHGASKNVLRDKIETLSGIPTGTGFYHTTLGVMDTGSISETGVGNVVRTSPTEDINFLTGQTITTTNASINDVTQILVLDHESSLTPLAGFGTGLLLKGESSTTVGRTLGGIEATWTDPTDATRTSKMDFNLNNAGTIGSKMRLFASGGLNVGGGTTDPGASVVNPFVGFRVNNTAGSGKILKADGTNFVPSTETYAAPGTSGNVMTSNGTNWISSPMIGIGSWGGAETGHGDSNYTILVSDKIVFTNAAFTAPRTWTLPAASTVSAGVAISVIDQQGGITTTNTLTIARAASDLIYPPAAGSYIMSSAYQGVTLVSDGISKWYAISVMPGGGSGTFAQTSWTSGVWAASLYTLPTSIGTSGKMLQSNGSNAIFSAPAYPLSAGASGNVLTSDGTNWTSAAPAGGTFTGVASPIVNNTGILGLNVGVDHDFTTSQTITATNATNNGITNVLAIDHETSGTPAAGLGAGLLFRGQSSTTAARTIGRIEGFFTDVTDATRTGVLNFAVTSGSGVNDRMRLFASGGLNVGGGATDPGAAVVNPVTGFRVNGVAGSNKVLKGNGTDFVPSTETYAAPSTAGNVMTSDGTNWVSGSPAYILCYTKSVSNLTTGTPADIGTITIPALATRWRIQGSTAVNSSQMMITETQTGTPGAGTMAIFTAASGGGNQLWTTTAPNAGAGSSVNVLPFTNNVFTGVNTLYIRQMANSVNSATISFYVTISVFP